MHEATFAAPHPDDQFQAAGLPQLTTAAQPLFDFLLRPNARPNQFRPIGLVALRSLALPPTYRRRPASAAPVKVALALSAKW